MYGQGIARELRARAAGPLRQELNMKYLKKSGIMLAVLLASVPGLATAQVRIEVEADPIAYAVNGYSGHLAAFFTDRVRAQVGAFGADVPEWLHGNDG